MLKVRHEKFCREYVSAELRGERAPVTVAARAIGKTETSKDYPAKFGYRLMASNSEVRKRIDELKNAAFSVEDLTPEFLLKAMADEAANAEHSRDKQSALKTLMQCQGMLVNKSEDITHKDANLLDSLTELFGPEIATEAARRMGYEVAGKDETLQ